MKTDLIVDIPRIHRSDMLDAFMYATVRIIPSKLWPKHATRTYPVYYQAHPLVVRLCWFIRRWLWIAPWVTVHVPDDADGIYMKDRNAYIVGERHYSIIKRKKL